MKKFLITAGAVTALAFGAGVAQATDVIFGDTSTVSTTFTKDGAGGGSGTAAATATTFSVEYGPLAGKSFAATISLDFEVQDPGPGDTNWITTQVTTLSTYHYYNGATLITGKTFAQVPANKRNNASGFGHDVSYTNSGVRAPVSIASFAITYTGADQEFTVGGTRYKVTTGENLLSGAGLSGYLSGNATQNGVTISFGNDAPTPGQQFTSRFFSFTGATDEAVSLTDASSKIAIDNVGTVLAPIYQLGTKTYHFGGNYAANPGPTTNAVPEPASWAMMLVGFGLVGGVARRRKTLVAA